MRVRGGVSERLVWSLGTRRRFPGPQLVPKCRQVQLAFIALPELASGGAREALNPTIELGAARRQRGGGGRARLTRLFELDYELRPATDLDRLNGERHSRNRHLEERGGRKLAPCGPPFA